MLKGCVRWGGGGALQNDNYEKHDIDIYLTVELGPDCTPPSLTGAPTFSDVSEWHTNQPPEAIADFCLCPNRCQAHQSVQQSTSLLKLQAFVMVLCMFLVKAHHVNRVMRLRGDKAGCIEPKKLFKARARF